MTWQFNPMALDMIVYEPIVSNSMMITLYHPAKTPIGFMYRIRTQGQQPTLPIELTQTTQIKIFKN